MIQKRSFRGLQSSRAKHQHSGLTGTDAAMSALAANGALWFAFSAALALLMAWRGLRKGSLSKSGAAAAMLVGTMHMWAGLPWGVTLIVFYLSGSKLTRIGGQRKSQLDEGHKPGGQRTAVQVLSNSLGGCITTIGYTLLAMQHQRLLQSSARQCTAAAHEAHGSCTLDAAARQHATQLQHGMVLTAAAFLGHYSCCSADTWASELGILARTSPRLILAPWRRVPPGTNGGVTMLGLLASAAGALVVSLAWLLSCIATACWPTQPVYPSAFQLDDLGFLQALPGLQAHIPSSGHFGCLQLQVMLPICALCYLSGVLGSLLDSLLGAALQYSGWHEGNRMVVSRPGPGVKTVCGRDVLSNDGINALAAAATSMAAALMAWLLLRQQS